VDGEVREPVLEEKLGAPIESVSHVLFRVFPDLAVRGPTREPEGRRHSRRGWLAYGPCFPCRLGVNRSRDHE